MKISIISENRINLKYIILVYKDKIYEFLE